MSNETGGPYLCLAVFCEKVIESKLGVPSLINIIDRMTVAANDPSAPEKMPPVPINITAVVGFKAGMLRGPSRVRLTLVPPSGVNQPQAIFPLLFEGEDRGNNIYATIGFTAEEEGLYWVDVHLEDMLVTRMPLRLVYQRMILGIS